MYVQRILLLASLLVTFPHKSGRAKSSVSLRDDPRLPPRKVLLMGKTTYLPFWTTRLITYDAPTNIPCKPLLKVQTTSVACLNCKSCTRTFDLLTTNHCMAMLKVQANHLLYWTAILNTCNVFSYVWRGDQWHVLTAFSELTMC